MRRFAQRLIVSSAVLALACSSRDGREPTRASARPLAAGTVPGFAAPACLEEASGCSSGLLLAGPDATGPELNAPNTLDTAWCPDVAPADARFAVQGITVSTPQGATMQQGRPIDVEVTVSTPPDEVGLVQLWYTTAPEWPHAALQWQPLPLEEPYVYPASPSPAVHARLWPDQPGVYAVRAIVGPTATEPCPGAVDTDDLAFLVTAPPQELSSALSPEDGTVVTGVVRLALQQPDASMCRVEYVIDGVPEVLVGTEPPFFPAPWDSTALAPDAGPGRSVTARANAFWVGSGACDDMRSLGQVSLRLAAAATCDPSWGRPTCSAPSSACGSARLMEGARAPGEPSCGGGSGPVDPTGPTIERILVRSRDGQLLAPGVPARVEVEVGGVFGESPMDVAFIAVDLAVTGTSQLLGIAQNVNEAVALGQRVGIDFTVGPSLVRGDPVGLQYLIAVVLNGDANDEETLAFAAPDRTPPVLGVEVPRPGAVLTNPVVLRATARDAGRVESVTFRVGDQPVGTVYAAPYELSVQLPEGDLSLTAEARDEAGNLGESDVVPVTVDVTPPAAYWIAPDQGAVVNGTVTLSVYAVDPGMGAPRAAERVELWAGERLIGTLTAPTEWEPSGWPRWDLAWDTTAFASGPQLLRAVAVDRVGLRFEADLQVLVDQPPTLRLVRPVDGEPAAGSIDFVAEVGDDLLPPQVEFLADGQVVAAFTGPDPGQPAIIEYVWTPMSLPPGEHRAAARVCDWWGRCVESAAVVRVVDQTPPNVTLTAPVPGAVLGGPVVLQAKASDDVAVTGVEYYANGTWRGSATAAPYAVVWDTTPFQGRTVTLVAVARDAAGNLGASDPVSVTVRDTTPPSVSLTSPAAGSVLFKSATLTASASDNAGVQRVQFLMDGAVIASDEGAPYTATLDVRKVARGTHLLAAVAIDAAGNTTTSEATPVLVK